MHFPLSHYLIIFYTTYFTHQTEKQYILNRFSKNFENPRSPVPHFALLISREICLRRLQLTLSRRKDFPIPQVRDILYSPADRSAIGSEMSNSDLLQIEPLELQFPCNSESSQYFLAVNLLWCSTFCSMVLSRRFYYCGKIGNILTWFCDFRSVFWSFDLTVVFVFCILFSSRVEEADLMLHAIDQ